MPRLLRSIPILLAALWLAAGVQTVFAEVSKPPVEAQPDSSDAIAESLKRDLTEARKALARFSDAGAASRLPEGIDTASLVDRVQDLDQLARALSRHISLLNSKHDAERDLAAAKATEEAWTGFKEEPPYSMLWADDLAKRLALLSEKKASFQSSIALFTRTLDSVEQEAPGIIAAEDAAMEKLAATPTESVKWLAEAATTKHRLVVARADALRANIDLLHVQLAIVQSDQNLLENELRVVRRNVHFSDEDLEKLQKSAGERQAAIRKEIQEASIKLRDAQAARSRAQAELDKHQPASAEGAIDPELELLQLRLTAAETRTESLQFITENLGALEGIEGFVATAYQNRRTLAGLEPKAAREAALQSLTTMRDRLAAWEVVSNNELAAVNADLTQQGSAAADLAPGDPKVAPMADLRAALWLKQNFLQRVSQTTGDLRKSISRWADENIVVTKKTVAMRFHESLGYAWAKVQQAWNIEVSRYEETTPTGGKIERKIVLGTVIKALLFFAIAYYLASRLSRRLQGVVVRRIHMGEPQANTLRTWLMILVGFGLAVATLNALNIPLTLFAFFGGALAIGLGFGTQTLIKNFISGIIVLFEHRIRVGDVVDIGGGMAGSITEINTRSSVLRGADGRESLVPNSVFLENTITNLTLSNRALRRFILIGVDYLSSPQEIITILEECADRHGLVMKEPPPQVLLQDFAENALLFRLYFWVTLDGKANPELVESDLRLMIGKRFAEAGIQFPFPQRDVHLKLDPDTRLNISNPPATERPS